MDNQQDYLNTAIENEKQRHKREMDNIEQRKRSENDMHNKRMSSFKMQRNNLLKTHSKGLGEEYISQETPIQRLNHKLELVLDEIENITIILKRKL